MQTDDLILVSVDDHAVEPPDMFEGHLPDKYRDLAPRSVKKDSGIDVWVYEDNEIPNIGLNAVAGRPPEEYNIEPTRYEEIRPGCFDINERVKDMNRNGVLGSMCFPSFVAVLRTALLPLQRSRCRTGHGQGLQRLARR